MKIKFGFPIIALAFVTILSYLTLQFYPDILWFDSFGYQQVWWDIFKIKSVVFLSVFLTSFIFLYINLGIAKKVSSEKKGTSSGATVNKNFEMLLKLFPGLASYRFLIDLPKKLNNLFLLAGSLVMSFFFAVSSVPDWMEVASFFNKVSFNILDPILNTDVGFYVFSLPFFQLLYQWAISAVVLSLILSIWIYFSSSVVQSLFKKESPSSGAKIHIFVLLSLVAFLFGFKTWLSIFQLTLSDGGVVFGGGFADVNVYLVGIRLFMMGLLGLGIVLLVSGFKKGIRIPLTYFIGLLIFGAGVKIIPGVVQNLSVDPNEMEKEVPYIAHNIEFTRKAYGLEKINEQDFSVTYNLTSADMKSNKNTIKNIRLWNLDPIKQTFRQLQEIRPYYEFSNVDVDRYEIDGELRQVMLSAREMNTSELSEKAQSWVNRHLFYTHGYGAVMAPVDEKTLEGLPKFTIKNIPPESKGTVGISRPGIYFGERENPYSIVNTTHEEFDFPVMGDDSYEKTVYKGQGGVELSSWVRRLLYSYKFSDINIFISPLITSESRIIYDRHIRLISKKIAPFLAYDSDPYMVIDKRGHMVWMQDAYVLSKNYPYSEPFEGRFNYIRNSVKITIDAYTGETNYYVADQEDPIVKVFNNILPDLFKPIGQMPIDLKKHIRYPKSLFVVQSQIYKTYHMTNPKVFYNREDVWNIPFEQEGNTKKVREPYYMILKLPGEETESFISMIPYTPANKNNMVAWLGVTCDQTNYGQLNVYKFPKNRTIFGPTQIESRIDQNTEISQKLTLWDQSGSGVLRGNIMIIPIENSLIYVEPIYLQATQSKLPELKRIILGYDNTISMGNTLEEVIEKTFPDNVKNNASTIKKEASLTPSVYDGRGSDSIRKVIGELRNNIKQLKSNISEITKQLDSALNSVIKYAEKTE
ncbi:UPF0182 family protein [bacterium]|jgi:uncharacterized protein|nr:UPF0182 family protein [bacterium]